MTDTKKLYLRTGDKQTVYLKNVITDPSITVGDYTMYNDFVNDPVGFERNNVLYHYPINRDRLIILFHCLRRKVSLQQRKPHPLFSLHLPLPPFL